MQRKRPIKNPKKCTIIVFLSKFEFMYKQNKFTISSSLMRNPLFNIHVARFAWQFSHSFLLQIQRFEKHTAAASCQRVQIS